MPKLLKITIFNAIFHRIRIKDLCVAIPAKIFIPFNGILIKLSISKLGSIKP
jgi:hypothetical protein